MAFLWCRKVSKCLLTTENRKQLSPKTIFLKKISAILFRISMSCALLIFLFRNIDEKTLFNLIKNSDKLILFYAAFAFFMMYPLALFRWNMLLKAAKINLPLKRVIMSFSGGVFFNVFLPSTIGGDFLRSMDLAKHTKKTKEVVATVFLDRLSGFVGLVLLASLALLFGFKLIEDKIVFFFVSFLVIVLTLVLIVLFNNRVYSKINKFLLSPRGEKSKFGVSIFEKIRGMLINLHQEVHYFRHKKKVIFNNLVLSMFIQILSPLSFYLIGLALGIKAGIIYYLLFLPIIGAITLLPISIGGLGLRDASTVYFFQKVGVIPDLSIAMSLLNFTFILFFGSIGGIIYVCTLHNRRLQYHK